jgi:hypothetical protein
LSSDTSGCIELKGPNQESSTLVFLSGVHDTILSLWAINRYVEGEGEKSRLEEQEYKESDVSFGEEMKTGERPLEYPVADP